MSASSRCHLASSHCRAGAGRLYEIGVLTVLRVRRIRAMLHPCTHRCGIHPLFMRLCLFCGLSNCLRILLIESNVDKGFRWPCVFIGWSKLARTVCELCKKYVRKWTNRPSTAYTYFYTHTHIYAYMHTRIHTYTHTYIHTYTHTHTHIHTCTYIYIHSHAYTHAHTYVYTNMCTHTHTLYIYTHTDMHASVGIDIHTRHGSLSLSVSLSLSLCLSLPVAVSCLSTPFLGCTRLCK